MKWLFSVLALYLLVASRAGAAPLVGTHYFYWYNVDTHAHIWDALDPPDDALQDHPINLLLNPLNAQDPAWPRMSFMNTQWHEQQLRDINASGIEAIFPIYWGDTGNANGWARVSLPYLVQAARNLQQVGETPPRIGMFFDTTAIALQMGNNFAADVTTAAGHDVMATMVKDFFHAIPQDLWATVDGKPIIVTYGRFNYVYNQATWDSLYTSFQTEFGVRPYIVLDDAWAAATGDVRCQWGAAPFGPVYHANDLHWANLGPGFDNHAVPGGTISRDREDGAYYQNGWLTLLNQMSAAKPGVLVETWNELHEGSDIAPTHEYGRRYINITRFYTDLLRTAGTRAQALTLDEVDSINRIYWTLLMRAPDSPAIVPAALAIRGAGGNRTTYALAVANSAERRTLFVERTYEELLGTAPSAAQRTQLLALYGSGSDLDVLATILASAEFYAQAGGDSAGWVAQLYRRLQGRWPSRAERANALAALEGGATRASVAQGVLGSADYHALLVRQLASSLLGSTANATLLAAQQAALDGGATPEAVMANLIASSDFVAQAKAAFGRDELQAPAVLAGLVTDLLTSQPLSGVRVELTDSQGLFLQGGHTGAASGGANFQWTAVPRAGVFNVRFLRPGDREQVTTTTLSGGQTAMLTARLRTRQNLSLDRCIDFARDSLELVSLDPDQNNEPYHGFYLHPDGSLENAHAVEIGIPHMVGRALDALLYAQDVRGTAPSAEVEQALTGHLFASFDNPDHLNSYVQDGVRKVEFHNMREGLSGLYALIKYRQNTQAATVAHQMLQTLDAITVADGAFSDALIQTAGVAANGSQNAPAPGHSGRLVGPLIKYYRQTGDPLAMSLAQKYATHSLATAFTDAGQLIGAWNEAGAGNHIHSITSTLSSLLMWAHDTSGGGGALNLIGNPGWDAQTGAVTLTDNFDNGATFSGWQCYALGGSPLGSSTFRAQADAAAVTPPNLFTFSYDSASGDSALRRDINPVAVTPGHVYKCGVWVRDVDGTLNSFNFNTSLFGADLTQYLGAFGGQAAQASAAWERFEGSFIAPTEAQQASWGIRLAGPTAALQLDEAGLYDITNQDRMVNGGFENGSRLLDWTLSTTGGRSLLAQVTTDAAEGTRAVALSQQNTLGDGALGKDASRLPWVAGHAPRLHIQVKDLPTLAAGESLRVVVSAFDGAGTVVGTLLDVTRAAGVGAYAAWSESGTAAPANTASLSVSFRIADASGAPIVGDVLLDDVRVFDASAGAVGSAELEKCRQIFDHAFASTLGSTYGWFKEERRPDATRGEMNCTGDMVQAALFLAQSGYPEYYEVAERYLRSFVFPVQLLGVSGLKEKPGATEDRYLKIRRRAHGCFGFPMPNDRYDEAATHAISALDVTAGTLQALCEFHRAIYTYAAGTTAVHLLFDVDDSTLTLHSELPEVGRVVLTPKRAGALRVRIPSWVPRDQLSLKVNAQAATVAMEEPYLVLSGLAAGTPVEINFPLTQWTESETVAGRVYNVEWLGDQVTAVTPIGATQPLFQASPPPTQLWGQVSEGGTGAPLGGCRVTLLTADGVELGSNLTDAGGNYAVDVADLPTGSYMARVELQGYVTVVRNGLSIEYSVPRTEDFVLTPGPGLKGAVTKYGAGTALAGATLRLYRGATQVGLATSQGDGRYAFATDLPEGSYRLEASAAGYLMKTIDGVYLPAGVKRVLNLALKADETLNLLENGGWDANSAQLTLGDAVGMQFDSGVGIPLWQFYALGGTPAGRSVFSAQAAADAVSGPNVLVFRKEVASADSAVRRESPPAAVQGGSVYKTGVWLRDVDATHNTLLYATTTFDSVTAALAAGSLQASGAWEKVESIFRVPVGDTGAGLNLRMGEATGEFQLDSAFLQDVTAGNRLTNPGFENSGTRPLEWSTFAVGGRGVSASIAAPAATGTRALRLAQTNTTGDGGLNRDATLVPWTGGQGFELGIALHDDPTLGSGEYLQVMVCEFNAQKAVIRCPLVVTRQPGSGGYLSYTEQQVDTDPACAYLGVSLRITNAAGAARVGDVLIDDVSLRVLVEEEELKSNVDQWAAYD